MITLVFRSSADAETAFEECFEETSELFRATLNRKDGTIQLEGWIGQLDLEIPDGLLSIVI